MDYLMELFRLRFMLMHKKTQNSISGTYHSVFMRML